MTAADAHSKLLSAVAVRGGVVAARAEFSSAAAAAQSAPPTSIMIRQQQASERASEQASLPLLGRFSFSALRPLVGFGLDCARPSAAFHSVLLPLFSFIRVVAEMVFTGLHARFCFFSTPILCVFSALWPRSSICSG